MESFNTLFSLSKNIINNMSNITTKLKFSRCREVLNSRSAAILHLREREFTRGEPAIVNYYEEPGRTSSLNTMLAIGVKNGKGKDCFRIVSFGQYEVVWGVSDNLPDVSSLVHGELYLYLDQTTGVWYYVSAPDKLTRILQPVPEGRHTYINLEDNNIYFSDSDRQIRTLNDVYTKEEIDNLISTISGGDFSSLGNLERRLADAYEAIQESLESYDRMEEEIAHLAETIVDAEAIAGRFEAIEDKTVSLTVVDSETSSVSGTFSSVTLAEGSEDENPIVIDKNTVLTTDNIGNIVEPIPASLLESELVI